MTTREEQAMLARQDAKALEKCMHELLDFSFAVDACGQDGSMEMEKVEERARDCLKRLVNYI